MTPATGEGGSGDDVARKPTSAPPQKPSNDQGSDGNVLRSSGGVVAMLEGATPAGGDRIDIGDDGESNMGMPHTSVGSL